MEQEVRAFLNKFIAALTMKGVEIIPFSGEEFQNGIRAVEELLHESLNENDFNKIAELFVKEPVEEKYQQVRGMFMTLNGQGISFSGADNPLWTKMSIKMNRYLAERILDDNSVFEISRDIMEQITEEFCEASGVLVWEEFYV